MSYYAGGGFGVAVAPSYRRAVEQGDVEVWECEEGILATGLQAAAQSLPFLPWRGGVGTSLPEVNPDLKVMSDPIGGETLIAVPPVKPDVTLLHAAASDPYGNVQHVGGPGWLDLYLHRAADRTVVQVERIIANEDVRANPWATTIASVDAVVRAPYGAHRTTAAASTFRTGNICRSTSRQPTPRRGKTAPTTSSSTWPPTAVSRPITPTTWSASESGVCFPCTSIETRGTHGREFDHMREVLACGHNLLPLIPAP